MHVYEFNEGLDGVIVAKSDKQAAKMLVKVYDGYTVNQILALCKNKDCEAKIGGDDWIVDIGKEPKKECYKKAAFLGWCNY